MNIARNMYALDSTKGNYAYVIQGQETILIDTGRPGQGKGMLYELQSMRINLTDITHIFLTHHDLDHIGNAAMLQEATGAKVWASAEDIPYIYGEKPRHGVKKILSHFLKVRTPAQINAYPQEGRIGDVEIFATPGHTPGHVCLRYQDVLFAGDLVMGSIARLKFVPGFFTWNTALLKESIKKVGQMSFRWVCPAHGTPVERGNLWEQLYQQ